MVFWILGKEITNFSKRSTKEKSVCLSMLTEWHPQLWEAASSQVSVLTVSDSWVPQMWKLAPVSAKEVSVIIPAEQGSASWVDTGVALCSVSVYCRMAAKKAMLFFTTYVKQPSELRWKLYFEEKRIQTSLECSKIFWGNAQNKTAVCTKQIILKKTCFSKPDFHVPFLEIMCNNILYYNKCNKFDNYIYILSRYLSLFAGRHGTKNINFFWWRQQIRKNDRIWKHFTCPAILELSLFSSIFLLFLFKMYSVL